MSPDKIIVMTAGAALIGFIYWFFLMKKSKPIIASDSIDITVEGGYSPETIVVEKGKPVKINFLRTDPSSCLEEVVLSDFKIHKFLPLKEKVTITITPDKTGEFSFACGMNMFHGRIIVR